MIKVSCFVPRASCWAILPLLMAFGPCGAAEKVKMRDFVSADPVAADSSTYTNSTFSAQPDDPVVSEPKAEESAATNLATVAADATNDVTATTATADGAADASPTAGETSATNALSKIDALAVATAAAIAKAEKEAQLEFEAQAKAEKERIAEEKAAKAKAEEEAKLDRRRISTRVFRLVHASATEIAQRFNATWNGDFGVNWKVSKIAQAFEESNAVMVTAPKAILDACQSVIDEIDCEAQQVYIEARFVELGSVASHKVGIDWSMLDGMSGAVTLGGGIQSTTIGDGVTEYTRNISGKNESITYGVSGKKTVTDTTTKGSTTTGGKDGSVSYFNGTLNFTQMSLTLRALDETEDARTFSNPKIIVSSGKKATVDMTTKYPNIKISAKRTTGTSDSLDIAANMEAIPGEDKMMFAKEAFFSWGITLEVTPRISTNGLISVSIVPTISSQEDWVETGTDSDEDGTISSKYPVIKVQRLISEFNLVSGTTAVIGGLSITEERQVDNGIPLLKDIPGIGQYLFGSKERVKEQKEIIVFVTVGLVDPHAIKIDAGLPKNAVFGKRYTDGREQEPGDRPQAGLGGIQSLDFRPIEEQVKEKKQ